MPILDYAIKISGARSRQKEGYKSSNPMSKNYELIGVLGELVYGYQTNELVDGRLLVDGDCGFDFRKRVQVKTSELYKAKHLIEYKDKDFTKFDYYVFVIIDLQKKTGFVYGWISTQDFLDKARVIDFGYGERLAVELDSLTEWKIKQ